MSVERYLELNGRYLREAEERLRVKDYLQASEKLWGAVAEIIKAIAAKRGINLGTHRGLGDFVSRLQKEHPELDLITPYQVANSLHLNFYEDHLPEDQVLKNAEIIRSFVKSLRGLT